MSAGWIKMRVDLFTHPKVDRMAVLLGQDEFYVVGALFAFWSWADKHAVDGRVDGATSRLVDRATRVDGLASALEAVGWLVVDDAGITLPSFHEHNGDSAKERSLKNQRQARWRERKAAGLVDGSVDAKATTGASTREEKRREEKKEQKQDAPNGAVAIPDVDPKVVADFLKIRRAKKAPLTETALDGLRREAAKAGVTLEQALRVCCERGWSGYNATWDGAVPAGQGGTAPERKRVML